MNLSNISKHAKAARNADIKRRESIIKENPQPVEPVLISQEPIITGEVHTEIPDEILMDMSELDAREAKEREENERKAAAETAPVPALPVEPAHLQQDLTEPVPEKKEYISAEDLKVFVDNFVDKYFPEKELRLEFSRLIPYHDMMFAPLDKTAMKRLCDDVTDNGMNESLLVVPADDGVYKIISGHNRKQAAVTLGTWTKLYCRVGSKSALTDEICHQVMAITNLFRVRDMTALELTKMIRWYNDTSGDGYATGMARGETPMFGCGLPDDRSEQYTSIMQTAHAARHEPFAYISAVSAVQN